MRILIVKTSSLGDIVQAFAILPYLHSRFPSAQIDWAVEKSFEPLVSAHPLIRKSIPLDMKGLRRRWCHFLPWKELVLAFRDLRRKQYDLVFDLQGNCKSGVVTLFAKGKVKVGFGRHSVREWPNLLATHVRFEAPKQLNIRLQHIRLVQQYFCDPFSIELEGVRFKIDEKEKDKLKALLSLPALKTSLRVMVCPGSKWINKQLSFEPLAFLLEQIRQKLSASFLLMWGAEEERTLCLEIHTRFPRASIVIEKLPLPTWQNLMNEVDLVLAVDSSALHLCGTTATPSFSVFGPTSPEVFKPIGQRHFAFQGKCPYSRTFEKVCPLLRSCETGACIRSLTGEELFHSFLQWWEDLGISKLKNN